MTTTVSSRVTEDPGIRFGIANGVLVAVLFAAAIARLDVPETEFLTVVVASLVSVGLSLTMTASISVVAWALLTGFVVNGYGELTLGQADLVRLAVFAASTFALAALANRIYLVIKDNTYE